VFDRQELGTHSPAPAHGGYGLGWLRPKEVVVHALLYSCGEQTTRWGLQLPTAELHTSEVLLLTTTKTEVKNLPNFAFTCFVRTVRPRLLPPRRRPRPSLCSLALWCCPARLCARSVVLHAFLWPAVTRPPDHRPTGPRARAAVGSSSATWADEQNEAAEGPELLARWLDLSGLTCVRLLACGLFGASHRALPLVLA
jgi:hypothetical protein